MRRIHCGATGLLPDAAGAMCFGSPACKGIFRTLPVSCASVLGAKSRNREESPLQDKGGGLAQRLQPSAMTPRANGLGEPTRREPGSLTRDCAPHYCRIRSSGSYSLPSTRYIRDLVLAIKRPSLGRRPSAAGAVCFWCRT